MTTSAQALNVARPLLRWYARHQRVLPWRGRPGAPTSPYKVWLSEMMLQQTTVATVIPYYEAFLQKWPTLPALAEAKLDDVLAAWAGLGYYRRARYLLACAQDVARSHGGVFPATEAALRALPGIGPYTAAAIAAIAFDAPANVVDGNVERVMARLFCLPDKKAVRAAAAPLVPEKQAGDYAQALMDLGATVCTPRSPQCPTCPLNKLCRAYAEGVVAQYPRPVTKKAIPEKQAFVFVLQDSAGKLLMQVRPETGLLAGMLEFPSTPWQEAALSRAVALKAAPLARTGWQTLPTPVVHVFTHFRLTLTVLHKKVTSAAPLPGGLWLSPAQARAGALPGLMLKVLKAVHETPSRRSR